MLTRITLILTFFVLIFTSTKAQGGWSIFLYDAQQGSITQVREAGEVAGTFVLPLSQGFNTYGAFADVSLSGRFVAYTAYDSTQERPNRQLFVFDRVLSATRFTFDITNAVLSDETVNTMPVVFDEVNQQVAFGVMIESEGWQIIVGDLATGTPLATLTAGDSELLGESEDTLPVVERYDGRHVWFTVSDDERSGFRWNIGTGEVVEDPMFAAEVSDFDPFSGKMAVVTEGEKVTIISAEGEETPLYEETEGTIERVVFIEFGARVLIEVENGEETILRVLNRDGSVAGEIIGTLQNITGTPDGFMGMFASNGAPALAHVDTTVETLTPQTLWTGSQGTTPALLGIILDEDFVTPAPPEFRD